MYRSATPSDISSAAFEEKQLAEWLKVRELAALLAPEATSVEYTSATEYDDQHDYTTLGEVFFKDKDGNTLYPFTVPGAAEAAWARIIAYEGEDPLDEDEEPDEVITTWIEDNSLFYDAFDYFDGGSTIDLTKAPRKPRELYVFDQAA